MDNPNKVIYSGNMVKRISQATKEQSSENKRVFQEAVANNQSRGAGYLAAAILIILCAVCSTVCYVALSQPLID